MKAYMDAMRRYASFAVRTSLAEHGGPTWSCCR